MDLKAKVGFVCGNCSKLITDFNSPCCPFCGEGIEIERDIEIFIDKMNLTVYKGNLVTKAKQTTEENKEPPMEQAQHYVCPSCYAQVPLGHKFCGKCGTPTPFAEKGAQVKYYGAMQTPGKARLIIIRGEEVEGLSYHLNTQQHLVGKTEGVILFSSDPWVSPKHANFYYREGKLYVHDEHSVNGVYIRIREPIIISPGEQFIVGEQVFRFELAEEVEDKPDEKGTYFFHSPWEKRSFRIIQILEGGIEGIQVHDRAGEITIGRDDCDLNFFDDEFMSLRHAKIRTIGQKFELEDLGSKNGTFVKIKGEQLLIHGDYLMIGKEVLRVEII